MDTGINNEVLDKIIKINNLNLESLEENLKKLKESIIDLDNCYSGNSINFISKEAVKQISNLDKIREVIKNYSIVLENVKISYTKQDENISDIIKNTNSHFN